MASSQPKQIYSLTLQKVHNTLLARGFDAAELLGKTGIREVDLLSPWNLLHENQVLDYYANVLRIADTPGLGLEIGWASSLPDMGIPGISQLSSGTVREAIEFIFAHGPLYSLLVSGEFEVVGDRWINRATDRLAAEPVHIFLVERLLAMFQAHVEELINHEAKPIKVMLDYPAPAYLDKYEDIFRCPIYFKQQRVELHYPASYLDAKIATHDPALHEVLDSMSGGLVKKLSAKRDIVNDVKLELRRRPGVFPGIEQVADKLAMSSRTLRRKLAQHDVQFQDLLDMTRQEVAQDYLTNTNLNIQQIAEYCGFHDPHNFSKAFKRWLGVSPSEYREAHQS